MGKFVKGLVKTITMAFNGVLAILGIAFLAIGGLLAAAFKEYTNGEVIKVELIWGPVAGLFVLGFWLIITSICGILAIVGSNPGLAKSYLVLLCIIIVVEIALAVCFIVYKQPINKAIDEAIGSTVNKAYSSVNPDMSLQISLDTLQRDLACCGNNGPNDYTNSSSPLTIKTPPDSCCVKFRVGCSTTTDAKFNQRGCKVEVDSLITKYLNAIISVGSVFAFMELIAIAYTCYAVKNSEDEDIVRFV